MTKKLLYLAGVALFATLIFLSYQFFSFSQERNQKVLDKGQETTEALRDQVNTILTKIAEEGERLADLLGSDTYSAEEVERLIRESALSIPEIQGVTACFEPYSFSQDRRLFCPYYNKGEKSYIYVEDSYDYSIPSLSSTWYTSVRDEGAKWVEPYYGQAAKDWYVDYGIPIYYKSGFNKGKPKGTITMSFICSGFKELIHSLSLGKTGYGLITSREGIFLAHPINEYVGTTNLSTIKTEESHAELVLAYDELLAEKSGHTSFYDEEREDETIFFYDRIPASGWGIGLMFFRSDLLGDGITLSRFYIKLAIVLSLLLLCLLAIYYNKDYLDEGEIWRLSIVSSALFLANIFLVGYLQHNAVSKDRIRESPPITDLTALNNFVNQKQTKAATLKQSAYISVPTGIYIQRMEFEDSYNLNTGGTIWQKYPLEVADSVAIGFILPQMSPFAEASYIEETYRERIEAKEDTPGYLLVGWDFRVTLRLNLSYSDYPLDKRHISIELLPINNKDHLIFTPDLGSYKYTNPSKKSGLNQHIEISGSEVLESYFNYSLETYDTNFGYGAKGLFEDVSVLHYNINLRRILLNAFVTYLIPIFVTLIMMFILIYSCTKSAERQGVIESMAAFFFVLVFSHIDLRKEIVTAELIYIEYFYFVAYFMIILATFNLVMYTKDRSPIFDFNDNQIFKAIYFPMFFLFILMITLMKFY